MQAREKNCEFTASDKGYGGVHGSGKTPAMQKQGGASDVRATQGDADEVSPDCEGCGVDDRG